MAIGDVDETGRRHRRTALRRYWPFALMLVAVALLFATDIHHQLSLEAVIPQRARLRELVAGHAGIAIAAYALIYAGTVALSIPGAAALTVIGGFLFGWLVGGVVAVFAATAGATVVFRIAHTSFGETLAHQAGPRLRKLIQGFHEDAFAYLLFLRLVPLFPFWLVNLAPGLVGTPPATFVLATLVGILPGTFAFSFAGAGLDSVVAAQMAAREACLAEGRAGCSATLDLGALVTPELIAACAALGLAALVPVAARRLFGRHIRGRRARPHVDGA